MDDNQNIEKFFRDKFNQPVKPDKWNTPEDTVWQGISSELDKNSKTNKRFPWLPLVIASLVLLSGILSYHSYQQKQNIAELQSALQLCNNTQTLQNDTAIIQNQQPKETEKINAVATPPATNNFRKNSAFSPSANRSNSFIRQNVSPESKELMVIEDTPVENLNVPLVVDEKNDTPVFPSQLISSGPFIQYPEIGLIKPLLLLPKNPQINKESSSCDIYIGPSAGVYYWMDRKKGSFTHPLSELLIGEKTEISSLFGIKTNVKLSERWSFSGGLEYYRRNQQSQYQVDLPYSTSTEMLSGNDYENQFRHSLPTGLGNVSTYLILSRSTGSAVNENENVLLDFSMDNVSDILSIPLAVEYFPLTQGEGLFFSGGVRTEVVLNNRISDVTIQSHHSAIKNKHFSVDYDILQMNNLNLSITTGIGYKKVFWNDFMFSTEVQYGKALNPVYRTENYRHDIDYISGQISISKKLN